MHRNWRLALALVAVLPLSHTHPSARSQPAPILLVVGASTSNPFGPYLGEILRAEGINAFSTVELSALSAAALDSTPLVVLADTSLTAGQAALLTDYVAGGGRLVAMRPDAQLHAALGVADLGPSSVERYLSINTGTPAGSGLPATTLPIKDVVRRYQLQADASAVATLYTDRATPTAYPAVVRFGRTVTWAYDLARSVVYTRQGRPENAGVERDGTSLIRSTSLFYGDIDLDRVALPHADVQMRLFGRVIADLLADVLPLPQWWYFPGGALTMLIPTADTHVHDNAGTQAQIASVEARGGALTMYVSRWVPYPTPAQATAWRANGHEFGLHPYGAPDGVTLEAGYQTGMDWFALYGLGVPSRTVRNHGVEWPSWVGPARTAAAFGIGLDTTFYTWGPAVTYPDGRQAHGFITGSGLPMRFVDESGAIIPVYQQVTSIIDEQLLVGGYSEGLSTEQAVAVSRQLVDASQSGGYSALVTQFHTDYYAYGNVQPWAEATMDYASGLGIPIWSAERWLAYTEARAAAQITEVSWTAPAAGLTVTVPPGAEPQTLRLPAVHAGYSLSALAIDGVAVTPAIRAISGRDAAFVTVGPGTHRVVALFGATEPPANRPPVSVNDTASVAAGGTVTVAVLANDTDPDGDPLTLASVTQGTLGTVALSPGNTVTYAAGSACGSDRFTYTTSDGRGGTSTGAVDVTIACADGQVTHTTSADFGTCGVFADTLLTAVGDGEVRLSGTVGDEYSGTALDTARWVAGTWSGGSYTPVPVGGLLSVAGATGAYVRSASAAGVTTLETTARFSSAPWEHIGWGALDFDGPYLLFSTFNGATNLYARTSEDGWGEQRTDLGAIPAGFHAYRIERAALSSTTDLVSYYIDGVLKAQHEVATMPALYVYQSHNGGVSPALDIDRLWVYPSYLVGGAYASCAVDAGDVVPWSVLEWSASIPAATSLSASTRTSVDGVTWSPWSTPLSASGGSIASPPGRFLQYQLVLATGSLQDSPVVESVTARFGASTDVTPPVISAVTSGGLTATTATIAWTTDEAATSQVLYGPTEALGLSTPIDASLVTAHAQVLTELLPGVRYSYRVVSRDAAGNEAALGAYTFTTPACTYAIAPVTVSLTAGGGDGSVAVTAPAGCAWTASSDDSWITITAGAAGSGSGSVAYSVDANAGSSTRNGSVGIAGQVLAVNQAGQPSLSIADVSVTEGQAGPVNATFTVTLSAVTSQTVTAAYATSDGTASAGSDYVATSGTVTFPAGTTTQTLSVLINGDTASETNETFVVNLSAPVNASMGDGQGLGTIVNDDTMAAITVSAPSSSTTNWGYGTEVSVSWTTTLGPADRVNILLSTDGGSTFPITLASSIPASPGSALVTVPTLAAATTKARIRVAWAASPSVRGTNPVNFRVLPAYVTVSSPNTSSTVWRIGRKVSIQWSQNLGGFESVRVELSTDGGASYPVVLFDSTPANAAVSVTVQSAWATRSARVRVTWIDNAAVRDSSNSNFVIR